VGLSFDAGLAVYLSGPSGLGTLPTVVLPKAETWAAGGDLDGDGYDDAAALLADGRLLLYRGGAAGFRATPTTQLADVYVRRADDPYGVNPQVRMADLDGDGLADIVGVRPRATGSARPEFFMIPGAVALERPAVVTVKTWPFEPWATPQFTWDAFAGLGSSASAMLLVADRGMLAGEVNSVSFDLRTGFTMPRRPVRLDDAGTQSREPVAVGDVNGDGLEDMFAVSSEDMDGAKRGELFLGTAKGISTSVGRYSWPYEYSAAEGNAVTFDHLYSIPR
jgi:hypothetical protein